VGVAEEQNHHPVFQGRQPERLAIVIGECEITAKAGVHRQIAARLVPAAGQGQGRQQQRQPDSNLRFHPLSRAPGAPLETAPGRERRRS
jgi:hypothetical protein